MEDSGVQIAIIATSVAVIGAALISVVACAWICLCCSHNFTAPIWKRPPPPLSLSYPQLQQELEEGLISDHDSPTASSKEHNSTFSSSFQNFVLATPIGSSGRAASSGRLFSQEGTKSTQSKQISRSIGNLMQVPQNKLSRHAKLKPASMSQDTGMSLEHDLELDVSLFESSDGRPRVRSEGKRSRKRRYSDEPRFSTASDPEMQDNTILEVEGEYSIVEDSNEAIANLLDASLNLPRGSLAATSSSLLDAEHKSTGNENNNPQPVPQNHETTNQITSAEDSAELIVSEQVDGISEEEGHAVSEKVDSEGHIVSEQVNSIPEEEGSVPLSDIVNTEETVTEQQSSHDEYDPQESLSPDQDVAQETRSHDHDKSQMSKSNDLTTTVHEQTQAKYGQPKPGKSKVAELRQKFLVFSSTTQPPNQSQTLETRPTPQSHLKYSLQRKNGQVNSSPPAREPPLSQQETVIGEHEKSNHTDKVEDEARQQEDETGKHEHEERQQEGRREETILSDKENESDEDKNEESEMLSASRPDLDLSNNEIQLQTEAHFRSNDTTTKRVSPLALFSHTASSSTVVSSQKEPSEELEEEDDELFPSTEDELILTSSSFMADGPKWKEGVMSADDDLSSEGSETELLQPLHSYTAKQQNSAQPLSSSPTAQSNLQHLAAKKRSQQKLNEAIQATSLASTGRAQASLLTSIPEEN